MLSLIADHHNVLDTTELDIFFVAVFTICAIIAYYIKRLVDRED